MPTTYSSLNYHLVFSTKHRVATLDEDWRDQLHSYLGGIPLQVGGVEDHVHVLASLKPTHCLADFMRELKKSTSGWIRNETRRRDFHWQEGYAAFTTGGTGLEAVRQYIVNQPEHHRSVNSRDELLALCKEAGIEVDMRFFE